MTRPERHNYAQERRRAIMMQFAAAIQAAIGVYNMALAAAVALFYTRLAGPVRALAPRLAARFIVALVFARLFGALGDAILPNSITWTILPTVTCGLLFTDYKPMARLARGSLLACSWLYSLSVAELLNAAAHQGKLFAALASLVYMAIILAMMTRVENRSGALDEDMTLTSVMPVLVVCASGFVERSTMILRSDFGVDPYSMSALASVMTCLCSQIAQIVVYLCIINLTVEFNEKKHLQAERHLMESRVDALNAYRESGDQLRILRHEVKNQYAYIKILLEQKDYERAEEFFGEMSMRANPTFLRVNSGNDLVDDIVNVELSKGVAAGVEISSRIAVPPELPVEEIDLCGLLMNLLDNAIEATSSLGANEQRVDLSIVADQGMLVVQVENPCAEPPREDRDGALLSSKIDASAHGYGTRVVRKIAEKYDGVADFSYSKGSFTARVMLAMTLNEH